MCVICLKKNPHCSSRAMGTEIFHFIYNSIVEVAGVEPAWIYKAFNIATLTLYTTL